jgi:pyruvate ferredoxin oxidoreductase alpha subunit
LKSKRPSEIKVIMGNAAAAYGVMLCHPDVLASYPITPQTEVVEQLARFKADGLINAEIIEVEGENSAMNAVTGAASAGGATLTDSGR